ncbi:phosphoglycerate kinase [Candidatus Woesearchaeota archaeon]|nr:phosphoglycerate kinase [Candidatus Woesearchaeota archaeon]
MFFKLDDLSFENKKVLMRCDYNVPLNNGKITDDSRIKKTLATINCILEKNAKQLILCSHLGKPKGEIKPEFSLKPVHERLKELLDKEIYFESKPVMKISSLPEDRIILLENLRFDKGEEDNNNGFAGKLAGFADVFVLDAFGAAHRAHASVTGIQEFIPACAGLLMQKEIEVLGSVIDNPEKPFNAIIGGAKADKIDVIKNLLPKVDYLIIAGILANTFLKAKGIDIKGSRYDEEALSVANEILDIGKDKIILPTDAVAAESFNENAESKAVELNEIPEKWLIMDIGLKTLELYKDILKDSKTIAWGGPIGVFEWDKFAQGTKQVGEFIASLNCKSVICGGDSGAAVVKFGLEEKMAHVSTGGGASLEMLSGKKLPGIEALEKNYEKFKDNN